MNLSSSQCKVGLVAIASNESAYLTEWVHHHLLMGFSPIVILVNRTQDRSEDLINQISKSNPEVSYVNVDFLAEASPTNLQHVAYAEAYSRLKYHLNEDDYIMNLDVDEFFMPVNHEDTVHSVLKKTNFPSVLELNWLLVDSDTTPFSPLWTEKIHGRHHALTKVAYKVGLDIEEITAHGILAKSATKIWTARGTVCQRRSGMTHSHPAETLNTAFLAHRMFRSPIEYLALLGRPTFETYGSQKFKSNRYGYHNPYGPNPTRTGNRVVFCTPSNVVAEKIAALEAFSHHVGVDAFQAEAIQSVKTRAISTLRSYMSLPVEEQNRYQSIFSGLDLEKLFEELA